MGAGSGMSTGLGSVDRLVGLAESLVGGWHAEAVASTTPGIERAVLRTFGVHGLDAEDRPLAGAVVDGYARDYLYIAGAWRDHVLTSRTSPSNDPPTARVR